MPFLILSSLDRVSSSRVVSRLVTVGGALDLDSLPITSLLFASTRGLRRPPANDVRVFCVSDARTRERVPSTRESDH